MDHRLAQRVLKRSPSTQHAISSLAIKAMLVLFSSIAHPMSESVDVRHTVGGVDHYVKAACVQQLPHYSTETLVVVDDRDVRCRHLAIVTVVAPWKQCGQPYVSGRYLWILVSGPTCFLPLCVRPWAGHVWRRENLTVVRRCTSFGAWSALDRHCAAAETSLLSVWPTPLSEYQFSRIAREP